MAVVTNPLMFGKARGTLARCLTYQNWCGLTIVRQKPQPRYPGTPDQLSHSAAWTQIVKAVDANYQTPAIVQQWKQYNISNAIRMDHRNSRISAAWKAAQDNTDPYLWMIDPLTTIGAIYTTAWKPNPASPTPAAPQTQAFYGYSPELLTEKAVVQAGWPTTNIIYLPASVVGQIYLQVFDKTPRSGIFTLTILPPP